MNMIQNKSPNKRVVVIGAGFGGLKVARELSDRKGLDVVIIDRSNHHLFQPLLYQVATAGLDAGQIATPIRGIFTDSRNIRCLMAEVREIDLTKKIVFTKDETFEFDWLVMACGSETSYFGKDEWEDAAPGLKTLEQATEIRRRILTAFEQAERETDPVVVRRLLTFVVVGGGPTGVELAGAIGELSRFALSRDFRKIDPRGTRIILIEAGERILSTFHPSLSDRARRDLEKLGVAVWTKTRVTAIDKSGAQLGSERVEASTVLWAAGVKPSPLNAKLGVELDRSGRVQVQSDLSVPGFANVFVIGDQAGFQDASGKSLPGVAPVALQQGLCAARNICADQDGKPRADFRYRDKGQLATIGRKKAVMESGRVRLAGPIAWIAWLVVHIFYLIGFRNRLFVIIQWGLSYFNYRRGAQLILSREWHSFAKPK